MKNPARLLAFLFTCLFSTALAVASVASSTVSAAGQKFAMAAGAGGMFEIQLGQVAQKNAGSAEVKKFGEMMVTQHGKAGDELMAIAKKENLELPAQLPPKLETKAVKISGLTGKAFDAAYISEMVNAHEKDLAAFQAAAKDLIDPALKSFAARTIPMIKMHLEAARKIQSAMDQAVAR